MGIENKKDQIQKIIRASLNNFSTNFKTRHISELNNPKGTINMKIHNVFISALGEDIQYYTALARSLDSSLGNALEKMAIEIAKLSYVVEQRVIGPLYQNQTIQIAELLEKYKRHEKVPQIADYACLRKIDKNSKSIKRRHESDYYLIDKELNNHYLIELKIGGDLDNKKARSEKEAILEQYAILSNTLPPTVNIQIYFATAYNRFGENKEWKQERVKQFFSTEELLIGKDFWNFVCKSNEGYSWVLEAYKEKSDELTDSLNEIKDKYL